MLNHWKLESPNRSCS